MNLLILSPKNLSIKIINLINEPIKQYVIQNQIHLKRYNNEKSETNGNYNKSLTISVYTLAKKH